MSEAVTTSNVQLIEPCPTCGTSAIWEGAGTAVGNGIRHEIADVALSLVTLAKMLGVTVEACIAEKTEHDRGRG